MLGNETEICASINKGWRRTVSKEDVRKYFLVDPKL